MALPGAGKRLKPPKGKGVKVRDVMGDIASSPVWTSNPDDPPLLTVGKYAGYGAAVGFAYGGPIGGAIGGVVGFFGGLFSAKAREEKRLREMRQRVEQYAVEKQDLDTRFVEGRKRQLQEAGRGLRGDINQWETYLHQSIGQEIARIATPERILSFGQTGRAGKITSSQFDEVLLAQSKVITEKTGRTISAKNKALAEIEELQADIEGADTDVTRQYGHERWAVKNLDKEVGHSEAYKIAKDESRLKRIERSLERV